MAALRAGFASTGRWLLLIGAVAIPIATAVALILLYDNAGFALAVDEVMLAVLFLLPYGLAWLVMGLRMTIRGAPTIIDQPRGPNPVEAVAR